MESQFASTYEKGNHPINWIFNWFLALIGNT